MSDDTEWYWDLVRERAVRASERGFADHLLGPYPSRFEAENWKAKVEERNEGWDAADAEWNDDDDTGDDDTGNDESRVDREPGRDDAAG